MPPAASESQLRLLALPTGERGADHREHMLWFVANLTRSEVQDQDSERREPIMAAHGLLPVIRAEVPLPGVDFDREAYGVRGDFSMIVVD